MKVEKLPTPCYIVDEGKLKKNLEALKDVMDRTGCKILLAQKAFSMFSVYPLIGKYLSGATASGLYEARLCKEYMQGENHIFSPAYRENEIDELAFLCDHMVFNSFSQLEKFGERVRKKKVSVGLRINPEFSTQEGHEIYDPCARGSRLGIPISAFCPEKAEGVEGLHFHTLCEQNADALYQTLQVIEKKLGNYMKTLKWVNFGGGHHITRDDYDRKLLEDCIRHIQDTYQVQVYLEPGEAVALNAGYLHSTVLEIVENCMHIAILDTSAACHMPDVLEMPYRPPLSGSFLPGEKKYTYRLAGPTCLAGDIIGDYSFAQPLTEGSRLQFEDMAIYSMVKNNTFNGMALPAIVLLHENGECDVIKEFGYEDFKMRLS